MKANIHPRWFANARVTCMSCGATWTTGATVQTITTEICSNCHPFYTGEQRIVDTEGRVDKFIKRIQTREAIHEEARRRQQSLTPMDLPISELKLSQRYQTILHEAGINVVQDILTRLQQTGDQGLLDISGIGRQVVMDIKKSLRARGYKLPNDAEETA